MSIKFQPYQKVEGNYMNYEDYFASNALDVSDKSYNCYGNSPNSNPTPNRLVHHYHHDSIYRV